MDTFLEYRIHRSLLRVLISLWRERERERERESLIFLSGEDSIGEFDSARVRILCAEFLGTFFFSFRRRTEIQRRGDRWNSTCDFISRFDSLFRGREREREEKWIKKSSSTKRIYRIFHAWRESSITRWIFFIHENEE